MKPQTIILGVTLTVLGVTAAVIFRSQSQNFLNGDGLRVAEEWVGQ